MVGRRRPNLLQEFLGKSPPKVAKPNPLPKQNLDGGSVLQIMAGPYKRAGHSFVRLLQTNRHE